MKRGFLGWIGAFVLLFQISTYAAVPEEVVAVGAAVGIDVKCSGLLVVGFSEESPARDSGLHRGDLIFAVDGVYVEEPGLLRELVQDKTQVTVTALRQNQQQSFLVRPQTQNGVELIGANVRAEMAGIGTVTYFDPATSVFGALGHGITDGTTEKLFPVRDGYLCKATILSVEKGKNGSPGMLQGAFDAGQLLGQVTKNTPYGIFGTMNVAPRGVMLPVGEKKDVHTGAAQILCNVSGDAVERFDVEISRIYPMEDGTGRNMMLKVTDDKLLAITGGVVQGMSGSPLVQDGKLIGAVTHVLVSDPQTGYGIFIENMLDAAR